MLNWLGILLLFCALISLSLFVFIVRFALRTQVVLTTALFTLLISVGLFSWAMIIITDSQSFFLWSNVAYLCSLLVFPLLIHLFLQRTDSRSFLTTTQYGPMFLYVPSMVQLFFHYLLPDSQSRFLDLAFMLGWLIFTMSVWIRLYQRTHETESHILKNQMEFMLSSFFVVMIYDLMIIFIILFPEHVEALMDFSFLYGIALTIALVNTVRGIIKYQMVTGIEFFFRSGLILMATSVIAVTVFVLVQIGVFSIFGGLTESMQVLISAGIVVFIMLSINPINETATKIIETVSPSLKWQESKVKEIFVLLSSGIVVAHSKSYSEDEEEIDHDIVGGMLSAIQNFVQEAFQASDKEMLRSLSMGDLRMMIEHEGELAVVVLFTGFEARELRDDIIGLTHGIHGEFGDVLDTWRGVESEISGIQEKLNDFVSS